MALNTEATGGDESDGKKTIWDKRHKGNIWKRPVDRVYDRYHIFYRVAFLRRDQ